MSVEDLNDKKVCVTFSLILMFTIFVYIVMFFLLSTLFFYSLLVVLVFLPVFLSVCLSCFSSSVCLHSLFYGQFGLNNSNNYDLLQLWRAVRVWSVPHVDIEL